MRQSSCERALGTLKNYLLFSGQEHEQLRDSLGKLGREIEEFGRLWNEEISSSRMRVHDSIGRLQDASVAYSRARGEYLQNKENFEVNKEPKNEVKEEEEEEEISQNNKTKDGKWTMFSSKGRKKVSSEELGGLLEEGLKRREELLETVVTRDSSIHQLGDTAKRFEATRTSKMKSCLSEFISEEKRALESRLGLISSLEDAVREMDGEADIAHFLTSSQQEESVFYGRALSLIDWDSGSRCHNLLDQEVIEDEEKEEEGEEEDENQFIIEVL